MAPWSAPLPDQGAEEVRAAVGRLRGNQPAWEALGPSGRGEWVGRLRDWLFDNDERVAELLQRETGKPWQEATLEVPFAIDLLEYYRKRAEKFLADSHPRPHNLLIASKRLTIAYRPYPVVGVICPWNNPVLLALADAVPALLAGAAVAIKPSELTPLATGEIVRGWREDVGAPGVLECLTGAGGTGSALVDEADFIQFTGSTRTGRKIAQRAAERLIPYSLELGGKDAMIVLADADLERAANAAVWGGMFNSGQTCTSVERVFVEEPVYDEFVELVAGRVRGLRQRAARQALRRRRRVAFQRGAARHRRAARVRGAGERRTRARRRQARGRAGGVLRAHACSWTSSQSMSCMREETFGPTLPVMKVKDVDEAIRLANDSSYGLVGQRLDSRPRPRRADRPAPGGRRGQRQRHVREPLRAPDSSGWLEAVRRRRAARWRTRDSQVLPPAVDHRDAAGPQVRAPLVPLHRPQGQALPARHSLPVRT